MDNPTAARAPKTWGPFTGRQLTVMISIAIVMVLFPVGAWAVTGNNVFVTDSVSGKQAKVNSSGQLEVHPNGTKLQGNGSNNAIDASKGHQMLTIEATPASWFGIWKQTPYNTRTEVVVPGSGQAAIVKTIHFASITPNSWPADAYIEVWSGASCGLGTELYDQTIGFPRATEGYEEAHYDPGVVIPAGGNLCIGGANTNVDVTVDGYTVPPSAVS